MEAKPTGKWHWASWVSMATVAGVLLSFQFQTTHGYRRQDYPKYRWPIVCGWPNPSVTHWEPIGPACGYGSSMPVGRWVDAFGKRLVTFKALLAALGAFLIGLGIDLFVRAAGLEKRQWRYHRAITVVAAAFFYWKGTGDFEELTLYSGWGLASDVLFCVLLTVSTGLVTNGAIRRLRARRQFQVADLLKLTTVAGLTMAYWRQVADLGCDVPMPGTISAGMMPAVETPYWYPACAVYVFAVAATFTLLLDAAIKIARPVFERRDAHRNSLGGLRVAKTG